MRPDATAAWARPSPYDLRMTTQLLRTGSGDPTVHRDADGFWRTAHTGDGPATVRLLEAHDVVRADAWGPGASAVLHDVPRWIGLHEPVWALPAHPVTDRLLRTHQGLRLTDTRDIFEALMPVVLQQLITWEEAALGWRRLCEALGAPAPGPRPMRLSPTARAVREAGADRLRALGIGPRQARTLVDVARVAYALQPAADLPTPEADVLLRRVRGVGPWTAAMVLGLRLGRPEVVPLRDVHLPHVVSWALAGEARGTDQRMQALLEGFAGQAFRVVRLLWAAGIEAPRRGPRHPLWRNGR